MINGINNNDNRELINARLGGQSEISNVVTNPISNNNPYNKENRFNLIDESAISLEAYQIYQRECDIKHFAKMVLSDNNENEIDNRMQVLFNSGIVDPFKVDDFKGLADEFSSNEEFLKDIEFNML